MVALRPADDRGVVVTNVSERKAEANRLNAQHSTGPRTPAGKRRASRNAVTHGVYCRDLVLPGESQAELDALRDGLVADLRPRGAAEAVIVEQILAATWKLRRVRAAEREMCEKHARAEHQKVCDAAASKRWAWDEYVRLHSTPRKPVQGPPPPPPPPFDPETVPAAASLAAIVAGDAYDKLARLEERLNRQIHRGLRELRLLRKDAAEPGEEEPAVAEDETIVDANEQNEPTADAPEVAGSAAIEVIVQNEPTIEPETVAEAAAEIAPAPQALGSAPPEGA